MSVTKSRLYDQLSESEKLTRVSLDSQPPAAHSNSLKKKQCLSGRCLCLLIFLIVFLAVVIAVLIVLESGQSQQGLGLVAVSQALVSGGWPVRLFSLHNSYHYSTTVPIRKRESLPRNSRM